MNLLSGIAIVQNMILWSKRPLAYEVQQYVRIGATNIIQACGTFSHTTKPNPENVLCIKKSNCKITSTHALQLLAPPTDILNIAQNPLLTLAM